MKIISDTLMLLLVCACCVSSNSIAGGKVQLLDESPDSFYIATIKSAFDSASSITVRYMSKTRTYPSSKTSIDMDNYWSFEVATNCAKNCKNSEDWLHRFLNGVVPSTECPAILSTLVEFNIVGSENIRVYVDHAGYCIYLPQNKKFYFSKYRFNNAIKSAWGQELRGM